MLPSQRNIAHSGGNATFTCSGISSNDPTVNISWLFTNSDLMNNSTNVMELFDSSIQTGRLTINQLSLSYNASLISCRVEFRSGSTATSNPSELLVLGNWEAVHKVKKVYIENAKNFIDR